MYQHTWTVSHFQISSSVANEAVNQYTMSMYNSFSEETQQSLTTRGTYEWFLNNFVTYIAQLFWMVASG